MSEPTERSLHLNMGIRKFSSMHGLSDREVDVLLMLLNRITSTIAISSRLDLSPNTVSNHLKSILAKTRTNSKTDLLSAFVQYTCSALYPYQVYARRPRVLVVDDDKDLCALVSQELQDRGIAVRATTQGEMLMEEIKNFDPDVVLLDIILPGGKNGLSLIDDIRNTYRTSPKVILVSGSVQHTRQSCVEAGVCDLFAKPFNINQILFVIIEQFIDNAFVRSRFHRIEAELEALVLPEQHVTIKNIGYGGLFFAPSKAEDAINSFSPGSKITLEVTLPGFGTHRLPCKVAWARHKASFIYPPGVGLSFDTLAFDQQCAVRDYVRAKKQFDSFPITDTAN